MARKNIFEILSETMNLHEEILTLETLSQKKLIKVDFGYFDLEEYIDLYCLPLWKSRKRSTNYFDMRNKLEITGIDMLQTPSFEKMLLYLEFMANMVYLCEKSIRSNCGHKIDKEYLYLKENINSIVEEMNFELKTLEREEQVLLVERNPSSTAVAEIIDSEYAHKVIEYNHFMLKGDIEGKQRILNLLANKFESIRPSLNKIDANLASDVGYLLNKMNIRHNNVEGKNMIPFVRDLPKEQLEEWYDETYQMILLSILRVDNIERTQKVKNLKQIIDGK